MTTVDDVNELIEQYQLGLEEFAKGNPEAVKKLFSHRDDVTFEPLSSPSRKWVGAGRQDPGACLISVRRGQRDRRY